MKTILAILLLTTSAFAQTWNLNSPNDTTNCVVSPGLYSEGWLDTLYGLPGAQGFWDMGQQGYIACKTDVPANVACVVTVQVTAWCDDGIYPAQEVSLSGTLIESTRTHNTGNGLGAWQTFTTTWQVLNAGETVVVVTQSNPFKSSVVDKIEVGYAVPRQPQPKAIELPKSPEDCEAAQ